MIYMWKCSICDAHVEVQRPIADYALPPDGPCPPWDSRSEKEQIESPMKWETAHDPQWVRVFEPPMQLRASFPDGHKRSGWQDLKESARLEKIAAVANRETKKEIKAEICKLGIKPGQD